MPDSLASGDTPAPAPWPWPEDRPRLLALLPLVHVAWSDGVLTVGERRVFAATLLDVEALDKRDRAALQPWLDPARPPSPTAVEALRTRLRELAPPESAEAASLTELGLDLVRTRGGRDAWRPPSARQALATAEAALGMVGREAVRRLLAPDEPPSGPAPTPSTAEALFDVERMTELLAEPYGADRARVLGLLAQDAFRFGPELDRPTYRQRVLEAVRRLADEGLGGLAFPREFGGAGAPGRALAVFETLAFGDLSVLVKYGVQFGLFGGSVHQLGTERHHRRHLADIARLALPGCYAMTEIGHGSNVRDLETIARFDPDADAFEITTPHEGAGKAWIGNAALHGRMATVFAQLSVAGEDHGVHAFLVPLRDAGGSPLPGIRIEDEGPKIGLNGIDNGRIWFERVRVPRDHLLDRFGRVTEEGRYESPIPSPGRRFFTMLGTLVAGRISIAAASVSAAKTALTVAVRYSATRRQFGPEGLPEIPILEYRTQQRLLMPALAATFGLHFAVRDLARRYEAFLDATATHGNPDSDADLEPDVDPDGDPDDEGPAGDASADDDGRQLEVRAAGLKALASRHCVETLQACREAMGGRGYDADNRLGRLRADTDVFTTFEGANVVLLQLAARGLLTRFREEMGDLRLWDVVRYLAERAQTRVTELNPVVIRRADEEHLRDPGFHLAAFRYREERLLSSAARRLKDRIDDGMDSFRAMNEVQDHLVSLARAHAERLVLEAFHEAITRAPTPGLSETLRTLATLHALARLEADRGWYLEAGYLEPAKSRAVREQVNRLCREVAEQAVFLVDAFGIPDEVLRAPDGVRE
jgi:acyl-CoA oxidase